jgi:1,4-alpha-glucan branching enzyme
VAASQYRLAFGATRWASGCRSGLLPRVERYLAAEGIRYIFLDGHGLLDASLPPPALRRLRARLHRHRHRRRSGGRRVEPAGLSSEAGYPGDFWYREFYRDIGYDLDLDYVAPTCSRPRAQEHRHQYYRITGKGPHKEPYDRRVALERAASHAFHFMHSRQKQIEHLAGQMPGAADSRGAYDAELYGHWWFEGPEFLDNLIRRSPTTRRPTGWRRVGLPAREPRQPAWPTPDVLVGRRRLQLGVARRLHDWKSTGTCTRPPSG